MKKSSSTIVFALAVFALLTLAPKLKAAGLVVSPSSVSNYYAGVISIQATGLTNGEMVRLERYLDANGNGTIEVGEPLVQSFLLVDGQAATVGGIRNLNIPSDEDGILNGQINARLNLANSPEVGRVSGNYLFRLSSPGGRFTAVQQNFVVTPVAFGQSVTGVVSSPSGALANAYVALLSGADGEFLLGTVANTNGAFNLSAPPGDYQVIAFKSGFTGNFASAPSVTLMSGASVTANVSLSSALFIVSGQVTDTVTSNGVPGVQIFMESVNGNYTLGFVDVSGGFSFRLGADQWKLNPSESALRVLGYLPSANSSPVVVSGNVSGLSVPVTKGTALIYGRIVDEQTNALAAIRFYGNDGGNLYKGDALSDTNGDYFFPASAGTWNIGPDNQNPGLAGYIVQSSQVTLAPGEAKRVDFVARRSTAHLIGQAIDAGGSPVSNANIGAINGTGFSIFGQTDGNGNFDLGISGGSWSLQLSGDDASQRGLVAPSLGVNVTDGINLSNIVYIVQLANRQITGSVKNSSNAPIAGINTFANASSNGTNYNANGTTQPDGSYSLMVFGGTWTVGVDNSPGSGLESRGYLSVPNQNVNVTSGNGTANFVAQSLAPPVGTFSFRHFARAGDFGNNLTPSPIFPVSFLNYGVVLNVSTGTSFPNPTNVFFTGPNGSGFNNAPADPNISGVDGSSAAYFSPRISSPSFGPGGVWDINYGGVLSRFTVPDPQATARLIVPVPTLSVSNDVLSSVVWSYRDAAGATLTGPPSFMSSIAVQVFDYDGTLSYSSPSLAPTVTQFAFDQVIAWSGVSVVRFNYRDSLTNSYIVIFRRNAPGLSAATRPSASQFATQLHGIAGQNYTIQISSNLTTWSSLLTTNFVSSPFAFTDTQATNQFRFYRLLQAP